MEENGKKSYPVRTLTVENFSVIKHAKLEFGKITVLIGPQASGKSLLCKLAYFLSKQTLDLALAAVLGRQGLEALKNALIKELFSRFLISTWQREGAKIFFESRDYSIAVYPKPRPGEIEINIEFSPQFELLFERLTAQMAHLPTVGSESRRFLAEQVRAQFDLLMNGDSTEDAVYFPSGRAFFLNQSMGFRTLNNSNIDPIVRDFSLELRLGEPLSPNPIAGEHVLRAIDSIRREMIRIAGGFIEGRDASLRFKRLSDEKEIPPGFLSSGIQELIPLFNVLGQMTARQRDRIVFPRPDNLPGMPDRIIESRGNAYVEEPEAGVFPETQSDLVRLFVHLSSVPRLEFSFTITTHSPYILSSFNNLIEAGQAARNNPQLKDEIAKIVPEQYWIKNGDFKAFAIEDGILKSILNESGFVEGNYLDQVSETIGDEFDRLIKLEYDHAKAS